MTTSKLANTFSVLFYLAALFFGAIGWVMNLLKLFYLFDGPVTAELIIRLVGIAILPLGAIAGYF